MRIIRYLLVLFIPTFGYGFTIGSGSEYDFSLNGEKAKLSIYIADSKKESVNIEFHFGTNNFWATNMWQQYKLNLREGSSIGISEGYIKQKKTSAPEKMIQEQFNLNTGVQLHQFLFSSKKELNKDFIGRELVELPAGSIKADHYRKVSDGQTIDYWISNEVKPIGLVKLVSKSRIKKTNNYQVELSSILKNVKAAIVPKDAVEMSIESKKMFEQTKNLK